MFNGSKLFDRGGGASSRKKTNQDKNKLVNITETTVQLHDVSPQVPVDSSFPCSANKEESLLML